MNTTNTTISKDKLTELLAKLRASKEATSAPLAATPTNIPALVKEASTTSTSSTSSTPIEYNAQQQQFIDLATKGSSCVLIGAAGTGKTTCMQGVTTALIQSGIAGIYTDDGHSKLTNGVAGIVVVAYTRRAVANIRKRLPKDLQANCITIHALLEYSPVFSEELDAETGKLKKTMEFLPKRTSYNPLSTSIHTIIIEEASMVAGSPKQEDYFLLYNRLLEAIPHNPQLIFLGDIQQLPPVFGSAILGYKMLELPVVELTQVYRQALESPIIRLAHRILSGRPIPVEEYPDWKVPDKLTIHPWKKSIRGEDALETIAVFFKQAIDKGILNPDDDIILLPFNKACGTIELNKHIANHLSKKRDALVHEIISGFEKLYLSAGDKILVDKEDAMVHSIEPNSLYAGVPYHTPSKSLNYWGYDNKVNTLERAELSDEAIDTLLELAASDTGSDTRTRQASHIIKYKRYGDDTIYQVSTAADVNAILLGYALTIHKAQGSEWRKVFCVFHKSHATMIQRELLYTAVTRAKEELYIICEPDTFTKGITNQRIHGNTWQEKAEFFKGKLEN